MARTYRQDVNLALDRIGEVTMQTRFPTDRIRAQVGQKVDATQAVLVSTVTDVKISFGALLLYDDTDDRLCKLLVPKVPIR